MLPSLQRPPPCTFGTPHLLDTLDVVPLDVLGDSFWTPLAEVRGDHPRESPDGVEALRQALQARGSFRLASRQSRQLSDLLTVTATFDLLLILGPTPSTDSAGEAERCRAGEQLQAFLRRLPRLSTLILRGWASEADLVTVLLQCGGATHSRITRLALELTPVSVDQALSQSRVPPLRQSWVRALRQACPALTHLEVCCLELAVGPVFLPLHTGFSHLTKLVFLTQESVDPEAVASLSGLSHLRHLDLTLKYTDRTQPHPMGLVTGLAALRHCSVRLLSSVLARLADAQPLLASTQLTHLCLWPLVASDHASDPAAPEAVALQQLAALTSLRSLDLGSTFLIDDSTAAVVTSFSLLTSLCVGGIRLTSPTSGHLPLLRHLCIDAGAYDCEQDRPSRLLRSLLPLLPLRSLLTFNSSSPNADCEMELCLQIELGCQDGADAAAEAAALARVAHILAAAPLLELQNNIHFTYNPGKVPGGVHLAFAQVADSLCPLAGRFARVTVRGLLQLAGAQWGHLGALLPDLWHLVLWECRVGGAELVCAVRELASLGRLMLFDCTGGDGQALGEAEWAELVAGCPRPLLVTVVPTLAPDVVAHCQALEGLLPGKQLITWL